MDPNCAAPRILYAGTDLRQHPGRRDDSWTRDRRDRYLLSPEVARPLSVERRVWGAVAGHEDPPRPWIAVEEVLDRVPVAEPMDAWVAVVLGIVAVDAAEAAAIGQTMGADKDLVVDPGWTFLGFDVADGDISGRSNCGYDDAEMLDLRRAWGPKLNDHGLFTELADVLTFRTDTDARIPEHAPFRVFGLWMVEALEDSTVTPG